ncbi:ataxin-3-like isoform X4 [Penaeus japonicus]|uniref:ataxin-3-like isoform X4 n=1 Tax=Penaeus japonicus TaxID=27405 RepID=UPI001C70B608|nr:ataxin-3-like isoform X4 [Penaeus japonicus]
MELIYHEKQDGLLCAQHCLNNLLQGQYFNAVDLAEIAQEMDQAEQRHMAEFGMQTEDFRRFMEQPSVNMDDTGMFSVQVITSALKLWDLTLVPYESSNTLAQKARGNPTEQQAYICNFKEHWLTMRKLGYQWFNLNSQLPFPEPISDTYLALFLKQLQHDGYSIFVVEGSLPPSEADETLRLHPVIPTAKPRLLKEDSKKQNDLKAALAASLAKVGTSSPNPSTSHANNEEEILKAALDMSMEGTTDGDRDDDLERAIQLSMSSEAEHNDTEETAQTSNTDELMAKESHLSASPGHQEPVVAADEDLQRAIRLSMSSEAEESPNSPGTDDDQLQQALRMSLDQPETAGPSQSKPDLEELRERRLAFLNKKSH